MRIYCSHDPQSQRGLSYTIKKIDRMKHSTEKKKEPFSRALFIILILVALLLSTSTENVVQGFAPPQPRPFAISVKQQQRQQQYSKTHASSSSSLLPRTFTLQQRSNGSCLLRQTKTIHSASVFLGGGGGGDDAREYQSTPGIRKKNARQGLFGVRSLTAIIALVVMGSSTTIWMKRQAILTFISFVQNEWLIQALNRLNAAGPMGLVVYIILFLVWEMTFGMTTPVEAAAGMAFGAIPAIIASGIAKTGGAFLTFLLARYVYADVIEKYIAKNELLSLMQESIQETPFRVALLCRFSPLPEFIKNAGMGVMVSSGMSKRCFLASLLVHGFSFTCLWSCMGAESARVMIHGQPPSMLLKYLLTGATWIGFGAPVLIGVWIKSLKDKQKRRQRQGLDDEQQEDSSSI